MHLALALISSSVTATAAVAAATAAVGGLVTISAAAVALTTLLIITVLLVVVLGLLACVQQSNHNRQCNKDRALHHMEEMACRQVSLLYAVYVCYFDLQAPGQSVTLAKQHRPHRRQRGNSNSMPGASGIPDLNLPLSHRDSTNTIYSCTFIVTAVAASIAALAAAIQIQAVLKLVTHLLSVVLAIRHICRIVDDLRAPGRHVSELSQSLRVDQQCFEDM